MKNMLKITSYLFVFAALFSCSPEESIEQMDQQNSIEKRGAFIGDDGQTPQNAYIRAELSPDRGGATEPGCPSYRQDNFEEHVLRIQKGALSNNDPNLLVDVRISDGLNYVTITGTIPSNSLFLDIDLNEATNLLGVNDGLVTVSVQRIFDANTLIEPTNYYKHADTQATLACQ